LEESSSEKGKGWSGDEAWKGRGREWEDKEKSSAIFAGGTTLKHYEGRNREKGTHSNSQGGKKKRRTFRGSDLLGGGC